MIFKRSKKQKSTVQPDIETRRAKAFKEVQDLLVDMFECEPDKIHMKTNIEEDLYGDSLDMVSLITALEDIYGIGFPEDVCAIKEVGEIVNYIAVRLK